MVSIKIGFRYNGQKNEEFERELIRHVDRRNDTREVYENFCGDPCVAFSWNLDSVGDTIFIVRKLMGYLQQGTKITMEGTVDPPLGANPRPEFR